MSFCFFGPQKVKCLPARFLSAEEHLPGHAYHTYHLTSPDGMVNLEFQVIALRPPASPRASPPQPSSLLPPLA